MFAIRCARLAPWLLIVALAGHPGRAADGPWAGDFFAEGVVGSWTGTGVVDGNPVRLERRWELDLAGHLLRADMHVTMANGFGFRAIMLWHKSEANRYSAVWMDEIGKSRALDAVGEAAANRVTIHQVDAMPGEPLRWQRFELRILGEDRYQEMLYVEGPDGWTPLAEFTFKRIPDEKEEANTMSQTEHDRRIDYIELPATDMEKMKRFYSGAFGWSFTDYGPDYASFKDGRLAGGLSTARKPNAAGGALVVLYGANLEEIVAAVEAHGGTITVPTFEFPGGRRFHFSDPSGNELAVWSDR